MWSDVVELFQNKAPGETAQGTRIQSRSRTEPATQEQTWFLLALWRALELDLQEGRPGLKTKVSCREECFWA